MENCVYSKPTLKRSKPSSNHLVEIVEDIENDSKSAFESASYEDLSKYIKHRSLSTGAYTFCYIHFSKCNQALINKFIHI